MAQTTTPMLTTPKITSTDVTDYRNKLATVLGGNQTPANMSVQPNMTIAPKTTVTPVVTPVVTTSSVKAPVVAPTVPVTPATGSYAVKAGDSLGKIAQANGMTLAQLLEMNPQYKANPNMVQVGASLKLSGASNPAPVVTNPTNPQNPTLPTQTPEQKTVADSQALAEQAGRAGMSVEQYQNYLQTQNTVSKEESDAIAKELGIPTVEGELFKKPSQTSQQLYQTAYNTSGLSEIKGKIQAINDEIAKERSLLTEAIGTIDENPFLTETSRVGRGKRILDQAEQRINNKLAQVTQYQTLYEQGINEINSMVTRNQNDFSTDQTINTAKLNYLQKKSEQQVSLLKDSKTKTSSASNLPSYLKGAEGNKAPTVIGNSESGFFKYDPTTKKFVQVVGSSAKTSAEIAKLKSDAENGSGGTTFKPTAEQKAIVGRFSNSEASKELGFTEADKARLNTDPNFFYWALQKASEAGIY